jgi:cobalt/nickel transport system permease protein
MGANILNMGVLTSAIGYGFDRLAARRSRNVRLVFAGAASWLSVLAGSLATALQLWLSGTVRLEIVMPAMVGVHAIIGIGEALITVAALGFVLGARPDLLDAERGEAAGGPGWVVVGGLATAATLLVIPLASTNPDGLEKVAEQLGFARLALDLQGPFSQYGLPGSASSPIASMGAGLLGVVGVLALVLTMAYMLRSRG